MGGSVCSVAFSNEPEQTSVTNRERRVNVTPLSDQFPPLTITVSRFAESFALSSRGNLLLNAATAAAELKMLVCSCRRRSRKASQHNPKKASARFKHDSVHLRSNSPDQIFTRVELKRACAAYCGPCGRLTLNSAGCSRVFVPPSALRRGAGRKVTLPHSRRPGLLNAR
jgi:hypothetical protein